MLLNSCCQSWSFTGSISPFIIIVVTNILGFLFTSLFYFFHLLHFSYIFIPSLFLLPFLLNLFLHFYFFTLLVWKRNTLFIYYEHPRQLHLTNSKTNQYFPHEQYKNLHIPSCQIPSCFIYSCLIFEVDLSSTN